jgi:TonB-dependent SusC/RagA subfamily outer membrane receptor
MMNAKRSPGYNLTRYVFLVPAVVALLLVFSLSKAEISKKGLHTFKSIANVITSTAPINSQPHISIAKENVAKKAKASISVKAADTIYSGKSKNSKKFFMVTSDANSDSINYMINGVKATKADVKAIDPGRVYSVDLIDAKAVKQYFPDLDNNKMVMLVTTDDSETGKALKEKVDKSFRGGMLAKTKNITITGVGESSDIAPVAVGNSVSVSTSTSNESSDDAPIVLSSGINNVSTSVAIVGQPKTSVKFKKLDKVYVTGIPKGAIVLSGDNDSTHHVYAYTYNIKADPAVKAKNMVYLSKMRPNDETTIDSPHPLIIIDGKEAKSLKNIASDDINSITILKDQSAKKLYGDKGKNGVIVIKTKKGK